MRSGWRSVEVRSSRWTSFSCSTFIKDSDKCICISYASIWPNGCLLLTHKFYQIPSYCSMAVCSSLRQRLVQLHSLESEVSEPVQQSQNRFVFCKKLGNVHYLYQPINRMRLLYIFPYMTQREILVYLSRLNCVLLYPYIISAQTCVTGASCLLTLTTRGIIPGSVLVPCMVCVLPDDVTPYAKIVTVYRACINKENT